MKGDGRKWNGWNVGGRVSGGGVGIGRIVGTGRTAVVEEEEVVVGGGIGNERVVGGVDRGVGVGPGLRRSDY